MKLDIVNGTVVTGDGKSILENTSVVIKDCLIEGLPKLRYIPYNAYTNRVIDANGGLIIPGVINLHAHGVSFGPFFPYGWEALPVDRILNNLNRHLLQGTTTIVNADGFALPAEIDAINKIHPVNVKMCTIHTPKNFRVSEILLGHPLREWNRKFTAEEAMAVGAVAIGEVGSPGTSYGTYEKSLRVGKSISAQLAKALDKAVLSNDEAATRKILADLGLEKMTIDEAKKLVEETSVIPVAACCDAIIESIDYHKKLGLPVIAHTEPGMKEAMLEAAKAIGPNLVATHVNHSFTPEESVQLAKQLRSYGAIVEVITADFFSAKQVETSPEGTFALLKEGLVDAMTTDFSGGYHEPILLVLQKAIENGFLTLPQAIQMVTSYPTKVVPRVAPSSGLIEPGNVADLCIVDKDNISKVRYVIIGGRVVVEEGRIVV